MMTEPLNFKIGIGLIVAALTVALMVFATNQDYYKEKIKEVLNHLWNLKDGDDE